MPSEFEFIERMKSRYSLKLIGDDCAVLPKDDETDTLITSDLLVQDIDFRLDWARPDQIGHKALAVSLSDVAAMGGTAKWGMISLGIPEKLWETGFADEFYEGWHRLAAKFGVQMIGGDLSRTPDKVVIDSIVLGEVPQGKAILRSGAKIGDGIYVTGSLGAAAGGLHSLENTLSIAALEEKQLQPVPELSSANMLQDIGFTTSLIDLSDGLSSDLDHICSASGVGATLYTESIPVDPHLLEHFPSGMCFDMALNGGEDLRLLFTSPSQETIKGAIRIGEVTANTGLIELLDDENRRTRVEPRGFRHF
jgi:thiamine-monophosphate kinase